MRSTIPLYVMSLILVNYLEWSQAVQCKKTVFVNGTQNSDTCTGDWCVKNVIVPTTSSMVSGDGRPVQQPVPVITYGCLSGFEMTAGCFMDTWNSTACFCQDEDMCNSRGNLSANAAVKKEVTCYNGIVKNGQVQGNRTCKGVMCQLSYADSVTGMPAEIVASCVFDLIPTYSSAPGCLLFANVQGGNDTWNCRCPDDLCNSPSAFKTPTRSGSLTCGAGIVSANKQQLVSSPEQQHQTCTGDFCLLTPMGEPPVVFSKGCLSVSNGAKVVPKRFKFDLARSTDIYACSSHDKCNEDVDTAIRSIQGGSNNESTSNGNETEIPATVVVVNANETTTAESTTVMSGNNATTVLVLVSNETTTDNSPRTTEKLKDKPTTPKAGSSIAGSLVLVLLTVFAVRQF